MKGTKKSNKKYLIILLIVFLLALAIGYAAWTDTLTITGTATANGKFDLVFANEEVVKAVGCTADAALSEEDDKLTVTVTDLAYPGAGAQFHVDIVNNSTVPAQITAVNPTGLDGSDHIKITGLDVIATSHPQLAVGGTCSVDFTVEWPEDVETAANNESHTFTLEIEYSQVAGDVFDGSANHTDA